MGAEVSGVGMPGLGGLSVPAGGGGSGGGGVDPAQVNALIDAKLVPVGQRVGTLEEKAGHLPPLNGVWDVSASTVAPAIAVAARKGTLTTVSDTWQTLTVTAAAVDAGDAMTVASASPAGGMAPNGLHWAEVVVPDSYGDAAYYGLFVVPAIADIDATCDSLEANSRFSPDVLLAVIYPAWDAIAVQVLDSTGAVVTSPHFAMGLGLAAGKRLQIGVDFAGRGVSYSMDDGAITVLFAGDTWPAWTQGEVKPFFASVYLNSPVNAPAPFGFDLSYQVGGRQPFQALGDAPLPSGAGVGCRYRTPQPGRIAGKQARAGDIIEIVGLSPLDVSITPADAVSSAELAAEAAELRQVVADNAAPPDPAVTYALARRNFPEQAPVTDVDNETPANRPFGEVRVVGTNPSGTVLGGYWPGDLVITGATAFHRYRPLPGERWYLTTLWDIKPVEMIYVGRGQNAGDASAAIVLDNSSWSGYVSTYPLWRARIAVPLATDIELANTATSPAPDGKYPVSVLTDGARLLGIADSTPDVEILFVADPESVAMGATASGTITVVSQAGTYKRFTLNGGLIGSARSTSPGADLGNGLWIKPGESMVIRWYMSLAGGNTAVNFAVDRWNNLQGGVADADFTSTATVGIDEVVSVVRLLSSVGAVNNRQLTLNSFSPSQDQELTLIAQQDIGITLASSGGHAFDWAPFKVMKKGRAYRFKFERAHNRFNLVSDGDGVMPTIPDDVLITGSRVLSVSDLGKTLVIPPGTAAVVLTCPNDQQFDLGWWCTVICRSANGVSFASGGGASIESVGGQVALGQFASAQVRKNEASAWGLSGQLS